MKSIKKFRSTRQALKQGGFDSRRPDSSDTEDDFPLGPRLFRKSLPATGPNERGEVDAPASEGDPGAGETGSSGSNGLKIIPNSDWEMVVRGKKDTESERPDPETATSFDDPPEEAGSDSRPTGKEDAAKLFESDGEDPRPVVVRPLEETPSVSTAEKPPEPEPASQERVSEKSKAGRPVKTEAPKTAAEKLKPYSLSVGNHNYVLVDEEGRLVKTPNSSRKPR